MPNVRSTTLVLKSLDPLIIKLEETRDLPVVSGSLPQSIWVRT